MIPIAKPWIGEEEKREVEKVLDSGMLAYGEWVKRFEKEFAEYIGVKHALSTTNGTQALILALEAIGVRGREVLVPSFTFIASATSIIRAGGKPVFVDVDERTFNIDPEDVRKKITPNTKAIMPVHLYGQAANMDEIMEIAEEKDLFVVEDAAQAHGSEWNGKKVGGIGHIAGFSFYPTKNMTTGEGGMVTTNDDELAERVIMLRNHGQTQRYMHEELGWNFRMTNIAAAIGLVQLKKLDKANSMRRENAKYYDEVLEGKVITPFVDSHAKHVYHQYTIRVNNRESLIAEFKKEGIGFGIYYPMGNHQQPIMKKLGHTAKLPVTDLLCKEVISIPVHPLISEEDREKVAETIINCAD
ncbi:putative PLP-dependent enzyme possibly involved in cell wall biogenesis [Aciduliprofundum sp. MAR08-339]|uniref:DegT/DnrJ/EryC1/StrS family aminotransferase n=1 Tax=Aciduliprofundum sp. (strain MAR08-339) TaxID=673860 RepID=UPI0002A492C0|nr:putative PLP-dependent enzyme possibly involved in cell wall biogenesis [Aciduliprofundum sp. MAR08-339]